MKIGTHSLLIKYLGEGFCCSNCGRVRASTKYELRDTNGKCVAGFRLCDDCQDRGYEVRFTPCDLASLTRTAHDRERRERLLRKRRVRLSRELEAGVAQDVGGRRTPGSGNTSHAKADIRKIGQWRLEHKFTDNRSSYSLHVADLAAVISHANMFNEWPGLILNFRKLKRSFVVLPYELFLWVVEILDADPTIDRRPKNRPEAALSETESSGQD